MVYSYLHHHSAYRGDMLIWQGIQSFCEYRFFTYGSKITHFSVEEDPRQKVPTTSRTHLAGSEEKSGNPHRTGEPGCSSLSPF